jgi:hypothetical protein
VHDPEKWKPVFGKDHAPTQNLHLDPIQFDQIKVWGAISNIAPELSHVLFGTPASTFPGHALGAIGKAARARSFAE